MPLLLALALLACARRGRPARELVALGCVWLLFLPNAPYVLTDFVHLGYEHRVFDSLIIGSFGATALALGLASLVIVQGVVTRARGALRRLGGRGRLAGRLERRHLSRPRAAPEQLGRAHAARAASGRSASTWLENPLGHQHLLLVVGGLAVFLTLTYLGLYALTSLAATAARASAQAASR